MFKNIILVSILLVFVLFSGQMLLASAEGKDGKINVALAIKNQEVGNKVCPVSGEQINEESKVTYKYQGKIYNLCCASCIEEFSNHPQKYIQIIEAEIKNNK